MRRFEHRIFGALRNACAIPALLPMFRGRFPGCTHRMVLHSCATTNQFLCGDNPRLQRVFGEIRASSQSHLVSDRVQVGLHRSNANYQIGRDLLVGVAQSDKTQNALLTRSEWGQRPLGVLLRRADGECAAKVGESDVYSTEGKRVSWLDGRLGSHAHPVYPRSVTALMVEDAPTRLAFAPQSGMSARHRLIHQHHIVVRIPSDHELAAKVQRNLDAAAHAYRNPLHLPKLDNRGN